MELLFAGGIAFVIFILIFFMYVRDAEINKRFRRFEKSIEDINLNMFKLKKLLKEKEFEDNDEENDFRVRLRTEIKSDVDSLKSELYGALRDFNAEYEAERVKLEDKVDIIEERIKENLYVSSVVGNVDENKIISLFQNGYSIDAIAKELNIGKGEVELSLKLANLK